MYSKDYGDLNFENGSTAIYGRIPDSSATKHGRLSKLLDKWKRRRFLGPAFVPQILEDGNFWAGNLYSLCSPGNQDYQKIIDF